MAKYDVNPEALTVIREGRNKSIAEVSQLSGIPARRVVAFENGEDKPNWGEIDRLAKVFKVSRLALGDPNPQPPSPPAADYRTLDGRPVVHTMEIALALDEARELQYAAADVIEELPDLYAGHNVPRVALDDSPAELAAIFRQSFGVTSAMQLDLGTPSTFYQVLRARVEGEGVYVSHINMGDTRGGCRGACLIEEDAPPMIIINTEEKTPGARSFSLLHEFYHVLLGLPGVSGDAVNNAVERCCNAFAAEFLMPDDVLNEVFGPRGAPVEFSLPEIRRAANRIKCSQQALALRVETSGYAQRGYYDRWLAEIEGPIPGRGGGAPMEYGERMVRQLGISMSSLFLEALNQGAMTEVDAYRAMNVRPAHFGAMGAAIVDLRERIEAAGGG